MQQATRGQITGRMVLIGFLCFFGAITLVNLTMAWFASNSWSGLVVRNSYVASQEFNTNTEHANQQAARGWHHDLTYQDGILRLSLTDKEGQPLTLTTAEVVLGRPSSEQYDHLVSLTLRDDNSYGIDHTLSAGQWQAKVNATTDSGQEWKMQYRFVVPHGE